MAALTPHELLARLAKGKAVPAILLAWQRQFTCAKCAERKSPTHLSIPGMRDWGITKSSRG